MQWMTKESHLRISTCTILIKFSWLYKIRNEVWRILWYESRLHVWSVVWYRFELSLFIQSNVNHVKPIIILLLIILTIQLCISAMFGVDHMIGLMHIAFSDEEASERKYQECPGAYMFGPRHILVLISISVRPN